MENRLNRVEEKLDTIIKKTGGVEEQFKTLNGSVARLTKKDQDHDKNFKEVYNTLKTEAVAREEMKGNLKLYVGIAIGVSAGITLIGAILPIFL